MINKGYWDYSRLKEQHVFRLNMEVKVTLAITLFLPKHAGRSAVLKGPQANSLECIHSDIRQKEELWPQEMAIVLS